MLPAAAPTTPPVPDKPRSTWVPVRALAARHRERVRAHLRSLPSEDRYLRFGYLASDEQIDRYVDGLDFERDALLGIFNRRLSLIALAHLAIDRGRRRPDDGGHAEFGVSVLPAHRGRGYGSLLFRRAMLLARNHHVSQLLVHALSENHAMLRIAARAGAHIHRDGGEAEGLLSLPPDTLATHAEALLESGAAELDYRIKWQGAGVRRLTQALGEWRDDFGAAVTGGTPPDAPSPRDREPPVPWGTPAGTGSPSGKVPR